MMEPTDPVKVDKSLYHLMPLFFDNRRELLDEALVCCESGDLARLQGIGHNFKGACGSYGFHHLSHLGEELQHTQELGAACELVRRLGGPLEGVEVEYV